MAASIISSTPIRYAITRGACVKLYPYTRVIASNASLHSVAIVGHARMPPASSPTIRMTAPITSSSAAGAASTKKSSKKRPTAKSPAAMPTSVIAPNSRPAGVKKPQCQWCHAKSSASLRSERRSQVNSTATMRVTAMPKYEPTSSPITQTPSAQPPTTAHAPACHAPKKSCTVACTGRR